MTKLYIAGPMRGIPEFNFPAFFDAELTLRGWGYETVNPARRDSERGFEYAGKTGHENLDAEGFDLNDALAWDLDQIARECDGVALLPNWMGSKGARAEVATAEALGKDATSVAYWIDKAREKRLHVTAADITMGSITATTVLPGYLAETTVEPTSTVGKGEEVRVTSATGGQKGMKLARLGSLDPQSLLMLAEVSGFGASKYSAHNFLKGYDWSLSFDAMQRHALAFWNGEDNDPESGLPHVGHVAWHALCLASFLMRDLGTDDRFKEVEAA